MKHMNPNLILAAFLVASSILSVRSWAEVRQYRHVLACENDGPLFSQELAVNFSTQSLVFMDSGGHAKGITVPGPEINSTVGSIQETTEQVTVNLASKSIRLSDGVYQNTQTTAPIRRIDYSYGTPNIPRLEPGWANIFAVRNSSGTNVELRVSQSLEIPSQPHRYVGSFYVELNPSCVGQPTTGTGECSYAPQCLAAGNCPSNYGRLKGVDLLRVNNRYFYRLGAQIGNSCNGYGACNLANRAPRAVRQYIAAGTGSLNIYTGVLILPLASNHRAWFPVQNSGISLLPNETANAWLVGHEEDMGLYE